MKSCSIIPILWLATLALGEPPVDDGYPTSRSSHNHYNDERHHDHHNGSDHQSSQESSRNAPSDGYQYNSPNARSSNARQSRFPPATVRVSFNQRFSSAASRKSDSVRRQQDHSTSNSGSGISQEYGPPAARSPSQEYGAPSVVAARTLSTEYGTPDSRSNPLEEYGAPIVARNNKQTRSQSNFRSIQPVKSSHEHSSTSHSDSVFVNSASLRSNDISVNYEAPISTFGARSAQIPSHGALFSQSTTAHAIPSARNSNAPDVDSISDTYGAPNQRDLDQTNGVPSPSSRSILMGNAAPSSYPSARSSPSSSYLPTSRGAEPSEQYGAPEQRDSSAQEYDYATARVLNELQNQEPASYDFGYQIEDQESGSDFGHTETREADRAQGSYFVVRPDGSKQIVEYEADERGFKPRISVEPADAASARAGGYDDNAQDNSLQGPY